jgi:hypothetical protein
MCGRFCGKTQKRMVCRNRKRRDSEAADKQNVANASSGERQPNGRGPQRSSLFVIEIAKGVKLRKLM